jgi:hypothetical protein
LVDDINILERNLKENRRVEDNVRQMEERLKNRLQGKSSLSEEQKRKVNKATSISNKNIF